MSTKLPEPRIPRTKAEGQQILRRFGYTGLKIDAIQDRDLQDGDHEVRIYALTGMKLFEDNTMRRQARTVIILIGQKTVEASDFSGWIVDD